MVPGGEEEGRGKGGKIFREGIDLLCRELEEQGREERKRFEKGRTEKGRK